MWLGQDKLAYEPLPKLNSLYFYLSSYCNLSCIHCWIAPHYLNQDQAPQEADFAILKDIIDQALPLGLSQIKISGGEPFLNKNIFSLISYAFDKKLGTTIETNGTLINDDTARFLKEKAVRHIAVSLDGPNPAVHEAMRGQEGCFEKAIEGIKCLKRHNLNVQVIMVLYKDNFDYLEDTVNLAEGLSVNSFKINPVMAIARAEKLKEKAMTLSVADCIALNKKIEEELKPKHRIKIILDIPPAFKGLRQIKNEHCTCGIKNILGILSDGSISICGIGNVLESLRLGDIKRESLRQIWQDNSILKIIRGDLPTKLAGVCAKCVFKAFCLGKCRAEAYYRNNDILSAFSFCNEASDSGVFPRNRLF